MKRHMTVHAIAVETAALSLKLDMLINSEEFMALPEIVQLNSLYPINEWEWNFLSICTSANLSTVWINMICTRNDGTDAYVEIPMSSEMMAMIETRDD